MQNDIVKSNALIDACYSPGGLWGMRVMLACLTQVKSKDILDPGQIHTVYARTLAHLCRTNERNNYRELKKAAQELRGMYISVTEKPNGEPGRPDLIEINVVSSCQYFEKEGKIKLRFSLDIIPYISQLKNRFTQYQATHVLPMRSRYGVRLYELCLRWPGNEREIPLEEFKNLMGITGKYQRVEVLKRGVINPAIADINRFTDISVTLSQHKEGRIITHLIFKINKATKPKKIDWAYIEKNARPGESREAAKRRLAAAQR